MIHKLYHMISSPECSSSSDGKTWYRAIPEPFSGGLLDRLRDCWAILTERAYAIQWPKEGELENALRGKRLKE